MSDADTEKAAEAAYDAHVSLEQAKRHAEALLEANEKGSGDAKKGSDIDSQELSDAWDHLAEATEAAEAAAANLEAALEGYQDLIEILGREDLRPSAAAAGVSYELQQLARPQGHPQREAVARALVELMAESPTTANRTVLRLMAAVDALRQVGT